MITLQTRNISKLRNLCLQTINNMASGKTCTRSCNQEVGKTALILEEKYLKFSQTDSQSLLKKYLTKEMYDKLKGLKSKFGSTLLDCVQSGFENPDSGVGIYAADPDCYRTFAPLFDKIIEEYHLDFKHDDCHPPSDWAEDEDTFPELDPCGDYIQSCRIRCARSLADYPFGPTLTEAQYLEIERIICDTLADFKGEHEGTYHPLTEMSKKTQQKLIDDHFLFKENDRFLNSAKATRFWPKGRGIYFNKPKTFLVWCNEEDHIRIIAMQQGSDIGQAYKRLMMAAKEFEKKLKFAKDDRLGYLNFCATNLGTGIRASAHIKLPRLGKNKKKLQEIASKFNLQVRGTRGEHSESEGGVHEISNKRRLGLTEYEAFQEMYSGISELIELEKIY